VFWTLTKTAIFSVVVPGSVGLWVPYSLQKSAENRLPFPLLQSTLGGLLLLAGVAIYLWCAWDFAVKGFGTPAPIDAPKVLVINGLYRFTRNPMYVGVSSMIAGQGIFFGSQAIATYFCAVVLFFNLFVLLYEEPALRRQFGEQYEEYCRRVPRWLIRLGWG
jgi:protein-S-isoprenylcysteine O-methyltransferase Ste14